MFKLNFDWKILGNIQGIKKYAEKNPIDIKTLKEMTNYDQPGYNGPIPAGINLNNTITIPDTSNRFYYKMALSIEEMASTRDTTTFWVRHFSVSTSNGDRPCPFILQILPFFGFRSTDPKELIIHWDSPVAHFLELQDKSWRELINNPT